MTRSAQFAARARRHVDAGRPRRPVSAGDHRAVVEAFERAASEGDIDSLLALLDPDVVFTADGGGVAVAARRPVHGAGRVARAWIALLRRYDAGARRSLMPVNGRAGLLLEGAGGDRSLLAFTVDGGRVTRIDAVRNPAKPQRVREGQA